MANYMELVPFTIASEYEKAKYLYYVELNGKRFAIINLETQENMEQLARISQLTEEELELEWENLVSRKDLKTLE